MTWIAGADGFKSQWCVVLQNVETGELRARICPSFAGLLTLVEEPSVVNVDIPIGLPEITLPGGRLCTAGAEDAQKAGPRRCSRQSVARPCEPFHTSKRIGSAAMPEGLASVRRHGALPKSCGKPTR